MVDDAGRSAIRSSQDVTKPANTALSDGAEDVRLAGTLTRFLNGHIIGPVQSVDGPGVGREVMSAGGEGLGERPRIGAV